MLQQILSELTRIGATETTVTLDEELAPNVGALVRVECDRAVWWLIRSELLGLLREIPSSAGNDAVQSAIEKEGRFVWREHSPGSSPPVF